MEKTRGLPPLPCAAAADPAEEMWAGSSPRSARCRPSGDMGLIVPRSAGLRTSRRIVTGTQAISGQPCLSLHAPALECPTLTPAADRRHHRCLPICCTGQIITRPLARTRQISRRMVSSSGRTPSPNNTLTADQGDKRLASASLSSPATSALSSSKPGQLWATIHQDILQHKRVAPTVALSPTLHSCP